MNLFRMNNNIHKFLSFRYISGAYVEIFGEGIQICAFGCCGGYFVAKRRARMEVGIYGLTHKCILDKTEAS